MGTVIFPRITVPHPINNRRLLRKTRENRKYIKRSNRGRTKAVVRVKFPSLQFFPLSIFGFFIYALLIRETFNPMRRAMALARKIQGYFGQPHLLLCVAEKKLSTRVWPHTRIKSTTKAAAATTTAAVEASAAASQVYV